MMGTEILKIDASWAEKLTETRVQFLMTPTVDINVLTNQTFNGDDRMFGCDTGGETTQCQCRDRAGVVQLSSFYVLSQVLFIYIDSVGIGWCGGG